MKKFKYISVLFLFISIISLSCKRAQRCHGSVGCTERKFVLTDSLGNDILSNQNANKIHVYYYESSVVNVDPEYSIQNVNNRHIIKINLYEDPIGTEFSILCGKDVLNSIPPTGICIESQGGRIDSILTFFTYIKDMERLVPEAIIVNGHSMEDFDYNHPCAHKDDIIEVRR